MSNLNKFQREFWKGEFGDSYVDRNISVEETDAIYKERTGRTFEEIFRNLFSDIDKETKIIELGCNVGLKLTILEKLGFKNLTGVEINKKAYEVAKKTHPNIKFYNSSIEDFDPGNERFDLVYTSGVLIHIHPDAINEIISKIIRLSNKYIIDAEYFSEELVEVDYRGHEKTLWKQNFPKLFLNQDKNLQIIKEEKVFWKNENLTDIFYLMQKI